MSGTTQAVFSSETIKTLIPRERNNTVVNLIIIKSVMARRMYLKNLNKVIFDLKVIIVLIKKPNIIVKAAARRTDQILEKSVETRMRARIRVLKTTVIVPVIRYFPKVFLCS